MGKSKNAVENFCFCFNLLSLLHTEVLLGIFVKYMIVI